MSFWGKLRGLTGSPKETPSPRELFMAEVEAVLGQMPEVTSVTRRSADFGLGFVHDGKEKTFFLENTFQETREMSPEERSRRVRRLLSMVNREDKVAWAESRSRLVPVVRPATMFLGTINDVAKMPVARPFLPFLIETVAIDYEDSFQYVMPTTMEDWEITADTVFDEARENAREHFGRGGAEIYDASARYAIWHVAIDDDYQVSRLLVPGWLASFKGKVAGRPVAIIPQRSILVVGGDGDADCLKRLVEMAEREYEASPRNISPALYTIDADDRVEPLVLPREHPLASQVAVGHAKLAIAEYQAQKDPLQKELGEGVFVATYVAMQDQQGRVYSCATWTKDVPSLLPKTDEVWLVYGDLEDPTVVRAPWSVLDLIAPESLEPAPDLNPPRWWTREWPDEEVLEKLRVHARS